MADTQKPAPPTTVQGQGPTPARTGSPAAKPQIPAAKPQISVVPAPAPLKPAQQTQPAAAAAPAPAQGAAATKKPAEKKKSTSAKKAVVAAKPVSSTSNKPKVEAIMTNQKTQIDQAAAQAAQLGHEYVACVAEAGSTFVGRCEQILQTMTEIAQRAAQNQASYVQRAMASPTLNTLAEVSRESWEQNLGLMVEGTKRISDLTIKVIAEASAPVAAQIGKVAEKAGKSVRA